jgi:hypothetical protein
MVLLPLLNPLSRPIIPSAFSYWLLHFLMLRSLLEPLMLGMGTVLSQLDTGYLAGSGLLGHAVLSAVGTC